MSAEIRRSRFPARQKLAENWLNQWRKDDRHVPGSSGNPTSGAYATDDIILVDKSRIYIFSPKDCGVEEGFA
jgi:hypothetical protein